MSEYEEELSGVMSATEAGTVAAYAMAVAGTEELAPNVRGVTLPPGGRHQLVDMQEFEDHPRRKTGKYRLDTETSLVDYLKRHGTPDTELFADEATAGIVAILNSHAVEVDGLGSRPGWSDHRAVLEMQHSPAWKVWTENDRKLLAQTAFAEMVEQRLPDFVSPTGAHMLELAQSFHAASKGSFESSRRLASGETQLEYREETNAAAGKKGELTIPDTFTLGIQPFLGGPPYAVSARFRYRIEGARLHLGYVLERAEDVHRVAFSEAAGRVREETGLPLFFGASR